MRNALRAALCGLALMMTATVAHAAPPAPAKVPAPAATPAPEQEMTKGALQNTIAFVIYDQKKQPVLSMMGDGKIGPNPQWDQVCAAVNNVKATQSNYATLSMLRALIAAYSKPCDLK